MKSIEYYEKAIALDTSYALAYSGLADAYFICGDWNYLDSDSAFRMARLFANKALILDNQIAEAYATLAGVAK